MEAIPGPGRGRRSGAVDAIPPPPTDGDMGEGADRGVVPGL